MAISDYLYPMTMEWLEKNSILVNNYNCEQLYELFLEDHEELLRNNEENELPLEVFGEIYNEYITKDN